MNQQKLSKIGQKQEVNFQEVIMHYLRFWPWIVVFMLLFAGGAYLYLRTQDYVYQSSAVVLVKDTDYGSTGGDLDLFADLGLNKGQSNLYNEIELLKSYVLIESVVKDLDLNVAFLKKRGYWDTDVTYYGGEAPFNFEYLGEEQNLYKSAANFEFDVLNNEKFLIKEIRGEDEEIKLGEQTFGKAFTTDLGEMKIDWNQSFSEIEKSNTYALRISSLKGAVRSYKSALSVEPVNRDASALRLTIKGGQITRNEDFLIHLIKHHEEHTVADKNTITHHTSQFISDRMKIIEGELSEIELSGQFFKSDNKLVSIEEDASNYLSKEGVLETQIIAVTIEKNMAQFLVDYMNNYDELSMLLPANLGFGEGSINSLSADYNKLVIERNKIIQGSNANNPLAKRIEVQLIALKKNLDNSLMNLQNRLQIQIDELSKRELEYKRKIGNVPELERRYREFARQQQIKESLYLYLLQKREENQIAMASTVGTIKILDPAASSSSPISPNKRSTFLGALVMGLAIPIGFIYLMGKLDNKIRKKEDLEKTGLPIVGEIPEGKKDENIVVRKGDRSVISEAFRMLRANLNFMLNEAGDEGKVIFVSSTIAGEGKTFNAINLAHSFALTGKKVLLVGMDLRAPKLLKYLNLEDAPGVTNFIIDEQLTLKDITYPSNETENLSYVFSGAIPPNPSELLLHSRVEVLFSMLRANYDYVIVDNAPIALVADATNIAKYADVFLYVVRTNYLNKNALEIPKKLVEEKQVKKLAFILNATKYGFGAYRSYGYGYGYGYGQSYGDVYGNEKKKSFWKRLF